MIMTAPQTGTIEGIETLLKLVDMMIVRYENALASIRNTDLFSKQSNQRSVSTGSKLPKIPLFKVKHKFNSGLTKEHAAAGTFGKGYEFLFAQEDNLNIISTIGFLDFQQRMELEKRKWLLDEDAAGKETLYGSQLLALASADNYVSYVAPIRVDVATKKYFLEQLKDNNFYNELFIKILRSNIPEGFGIGIEGNYTGATDSSWFSSATWDDKNPLSPGQQEIITELGQTLAYRNCIIKSTPTMAEIMSVNRRKGFSSPGDKHEVYNKSLIAEAYAASGQNITPLLGLGFGKQYTGIEGGKLLDSTILVKGAEEAPPGFVVLQLESKKSLVKKQALDLASSPDSLAFYFFSLLYMKQIQYLKGFETTNNGRPNLKKPIWEKLTSSALEANVKKFCRLTQHPWSYYEQRENNRLDLPLYNEYFFLQGGGQSPIYATPQPEGPKITSKVDITTNKTVEIITNIATEDIQSINPSDTETTTPSPPISPPNPIGAGGLALLGPGAIGGPTIPPQPQTQGLGGFGVAGDGEVGVGGAQGIGGVGGVQSAVVGMGSLGHTLYTNGGNGIGGTGGGYP